MHDQMAAAQVAFFKLLGHHGVVTGTGILVAGTTVAHLDIVIAGMVVDKGIFVAVLADKMGETAENRVEEWSPTMAVMVAAVSLVVLRVAKGLVSTARGRTKGVEKVHQMPAVGVQTVRLTGATKVHAKAHWILEP